MLSTCCMCTGLSFEGSAHLNSLDGHLKGWWPMLASKTEARMGVLLHLEVPESRV